MEKITVRKIMEIHDRIVAETGGDKRILSEATHYQFILQVNLIHKCVPQAAHILFPFVHTRYSGKKTLKLHSS